ncbi:MAG TPA: hypothetical protein DCG49_13460 [Ruminococcus sp.]|nr:hypothetical protein [Ruminococcus sp.]
MGVLILKICIGLVCSVAFAGIISWLSVNYLDQKKAPILTVLKEHKKLTVITAICYCAIAVFSLAMQHQHSHPFFSVIQYIILWDVVLSVAWIDHKVKKIPNQFMLILLAVRAVGVIIDVIQSPDNVIPILSGALLGMFVGGFIILICMLISRGGIGAGDMKLFGVIGFYFGVAGIIQVMMYSLMLSAVFSIGMLIARKAKLKSTLAMAPFIFLGLSVFLIFLMMME